jgi:hypothetical protein
MFRTLVRGVVLATLATLCTASLAHAADRVPPAEGIAETLMLAAPAAACPAGAVCFEAPSYSFTPAPPPALSVGRVAFLPPAGVAKRFKLTMKVTVGPWSPEETDGKHLIYWFVVSKNIDMPGLLYFRGPGKNQAFARHGMGLTHPQKIKIIKPFEAKVGHTYRVENDYDMAGGLYTVKITDLETDKVAVSLRGKPNVTSYRIKPGAKFLVDMGFYPGKVETEVPSYGWKYSDIRVEAYMQ